MDAVPVVDSLDAVPGASRSTSLENFARGISAISGISGFGRDISDFSLANLGFDGRGTSVEEFGDLGVANAEVLLATERQPSTGLRIAPPRSASISRVVSAPARSSSKVGAENFLDEAIIDATPAGADAFDALGVVTTAPVVAAPRLARSATAGHPNATRPVLPVLPSQGPAVGGPAAALVGGHRRGRTGIVDGDGDVAMALPVVADVVAAPTRRGRGRGRGRVSVNASQHTAAAAGAHSRTQRDRLLSSDSSSGDHDGSCSDNGNLCHITTQPAAAATATATAPRTRPRKRRRRSPSNAGAGAGAGAGSEDAALEAANRAADLAALEGLTGAERAKKRRELRLRRNRESAFRSRLRRKAQNERMVAELKQLRVVADDQRKDITALQEHSGVLHSEVLRLRQCLRRRGAGDDECGADLPPVPATISGPIPVASHRSTSTGSGGGGTSSDAAERDEAADLDARRRRARANAGRAGVALLAVVFAFSLAVFTTTDRMHLSMHGGVPAPGTVLMATPVARGRTLLFDSGSGSGSGAGVDDVAVDSALAAVAAAADADAALPAPVPQLWSPSAFVMLGFHAVGVDGVATRVLAAAAVGVALFAAAAVLVLRWSAGKVFPQPSYYSDNGSALPTATTGVDLSQVATPKQHKHKHKHKLKLKHKPVKSRLRSSTGKLVAGGSGSSSSGGGVAFPRAAATESEEALRMAADFQRIQKWYQAACAAGVDLAPPLSRAASTSDLVGDADGCGGVKGAGGACCRPRAVSHTCGADLGLDTSDVDVDQLADELMRFEEPSYVSTGVFGAGASIACH